MKLLQATSVCMCVGFAQAFVLPMPAAPCSASSAVTVRRRCRHADSPARALHALVDADAEYVRQQLKEKQDAYESKRRSDAAAAAKQGRGATAVIPLAELPSIPYINSEGLVSSVEAGPGVKASVYAVFDAAGALAYVGVSRSVQQSLRLHLGRCPEQTHSVKVQHIMTPSRTLLEVIRDEWIAEAGGAPPGCDGGAEQAKWESPMDVKPLMTEQDKADLMAAREKGREDGAIKKIARRFEAEKVAVLEARGVKENMRFDPKLKGSGLLDIWQPGPDTSVPKTKK
jgi:hypothetical protein